MSKPKQDVPATGTRPIAPSGTTYLFTQRERKRAPAMTSERIALDLEAFRRKGGKIEVLGTTRSLTRIGRDQAPPTPAPARARAT
ncbi:MAG TPA: hypothetical protein VK000_10350 [Luteimonas sp.]|nr:hypothetical protein [Luteimonas sp.]